MANSKVTTFTIRGSDRSVAEVETDDAVFLRRLKKLDIPLTYDPSTKKYTATFNSKHLSLRKIAARPPMSDATKAELRERLATARAVKEGKL